MSDKKVELNEENLEGVAGGLGDVNVDTKTGVGTKIQGNKTDTRTVSNQGSKSDSSSENITNTNTGSVQKVGQQGVGNEIGKNGLIEM